LAEFFRVYLPTLVDASACYKVPIAVGYTCVAVGKVGHFTALVGVHGELHHLPLVDEHGDDLPVRWERGREGGREGGRE
ncbi:unnamed protein product, partial [Laminaria digitata]